MVTRSRLKRGVSPREWNRLKHQKFLVKDTSDGKIHKWSVEQILREVNRGRSSEWTPYDAKDWKEGLEEFTEFKLIGPATR